MEARRFRAIGLALFCLASLGASSQTRNFIVHTADPHHAAAFAQQAERLRRELAIAWLGQVLPDWSYPCPITATVGPHLGAGGATSFVFDRGEVYGWRMTIQGSYERIMDSVLPHEITHMIFASYFRRPLPRWADEGGATTVEHESEKAKHRQMLVQFLRSYRGIPFDRMFAMTEYPADILPLYAQAYALAEYLIQQGGRRKYVDFVADGLNSGRWTEALQKHYGIRDLQTLQNQWVAWVGQGFPALQSGPERMLASSGAGSTPAAGISGTASIPGGAATTPSPVGSGPPAVGSVGGISPGSPGSGSPPLAVVSAVPLGAAGTNPVPTGGGAMGWASSGQPSATPSSVPVATDGQPLRDGSGIPFANASTGHNQAVADDGLVSLASNRPPYQPGSTARPGIIWTLPLVPLPETPAPGAPIAQAAGTQNPVGHLSQTGSQTADSRRYQSGALEEKSPASRLAAGSRPLFAPGSIGKALASPPAFQPLPSSGAVDSQLSRPQMPQSTPGILIPQPNTALR